jgi:flagellar biosynthesis protein FlhA
VTILETLADHAGSTRDVAGLVELCRAALGRAICDAHRNPDGTVTAVTLSPRLENLLGSSLSGASGTVQLTPEINRSLVEKIGALVEKAVANGKQPIVLTSSRLRSAIRRLLEPVMPHVAVLSFAEVTAGTAVTSIGTVNVDDE